MNKSFFTPNHSLSPVRGDFSLLSHPPKAAFIAVLYCMHGQRDEKGLNLSPKCKNKFIFVNTKPSLNQNEVETSHRLYTHQKIMNKKAERREKWPRTELRLWLGGEKRFILPPKAAFCSLSRDQCCSINCASLYRVNVMKKDSIYPQTQEYDLFCHINAFCHSKRSQSNIQTPYTSTKMNEMSWEREESPRVGLSLWLGGEKRFILPPKAAFCCSHMINIAVSIVQVISVRPRAWQKPSSLIQDAVDRHQTHQTYNRKERSQLNLEINLLALFRGLNSSLIQDAVDLICPQMQGKWSILSYQSLLPFKT